MRRGTRTGLLTCPARRLVDGENFDTCLFEQTTHVLGMMYKTILMAILLVYILKLS